MLRKTFYAMLTVILMMGAASAQIKPGVTLKDDKPPRTKQQKEYDKAVDQEYQSTIKKIPEQKKSDPWGDIRTTSPPAAAKNKQQ
jgi:hypothetical protein